MLKLGNVIYEKHLDIKGKRAIVKGIYEYISKNAPPYCTADGGVKECHTSVLFVKNDDEIKRNWWYKDIKFHVWNESRWDAVSKKLVHDNKRFSSKHVNNMIVDIGDGTMNGHSFMSFQGYFIDPYLKSLNVRENEIQKFGRYFLSIM